MSWEWYMLGSNSPPVFNSGFEVEEFNDYATQGFSELLDYSPLSDDVDILDANLVSIQTLKAIVQNNDSDTVERSRERQILTSIGILKIGMYIKYKDINWLIISFPDNNKIYDKAVIKKCNYVLPFQTTNKTIINQPCIVEIQSESTTGEKEDKLITLPDTQRIVYVQYDLNTKYLVEGKRIFIDTDSDIHKPKVYHVSKVDRICYMDGENGLWKLTCDEDLVRDTDNTTLKIADYISVSPPPPSSTTCKIEYTGLPQIRIGGSAKTFTAKYYDTSGNELTDIISVWNVALPTGLESYFTVVPNGNLISVQAADIISIEGQKVTLNVSSEDGLYSTSLEIEVINAI